MTDLDALTEALDGELGARLADADAQLARQFPGDAPGRQPVHTVYVPADRFHTGLAADWGDQASAVLAEHAGAPEQLASIFGLDPSIAAAVHEAVLAKLAREPIEDLRIDFEDGYGARPERDEDAAAWAAAQALADALEAGTAPPFHGIRVKSLEAATRRRGVRTLTAFVETLSSRGALTEAFVVTLPKVTSVDQVRAMVWLCQQLESSNGLPDGRLRFELQIETPQSVLGPDGTALVARMVHASETRCTALHYGTYDYSAACGVSAAYQSMEHPAADHAKAVMQAAAAGTGVRLSDGSTNVLPVGSAEAVLQAWRLHYRLVRRSLERAYYQGWDLHPAQLPSRFVAVYAFYREGFGEAASRLRAYLDRADSGFLDEPATAVALAGYLLRAEQCGAVTPAEVAQATGLDRSGLSAVATELGRRRR